MSRSNGLPHNVSITLVDGPPTSPDDALEQLRAAGADTTNLSAEMVARLQQAAARLMHSLAHEPGALEVLEENPAEFVRQREPGLPAPAGHVTGITSGRLTVRHSGIEADVARLASEIDDWLAGSPANAEYLMRNPGAVLDMLGGSYSRPVREAVMKALQGARQPMTRIRGEIK